MVIVHVLTMLRVEVDTDDEEVAITQAEKEVNNLVIPRPDIHVEEIWDAKTNIHIAH